MILIPSGFGKLYAAGWLGIGAGAFTFMDATQEGPVTAPDGFEWKIISVLIGIVGVLLLAAWNDLKKRDDESRADRRELYQRINTLDKEVARLETHQDRQNHGRDRE